MDFLFSISSGVFVFHFQFIINNKNQYKTQRHLWTQEHEYKLACGQHITWTVNKLLSSLDCEGTRFVMNTSPHEPRLSLNVIGNEAGCCPTVWSVCPLHENTHRPDKALGWWHFNFFRHVLVPRLLIESMTFLWLGGVASSTELPSGKCAWFHIPNWLLIEPRGVLFCHWKWASKPAWA